MQTHRILALFIAFIGLASCADTNQIVRLSGDPNSKLDINGSVYISTPKDGIYGNKTYIGSGANTALILQSAFAEKIRNVEVGREYENYKTALESARRNKTNYLVFTTILRWEDRATEWSGIPDKAEIKVETIDANTDKTISSSIIKGRSGIATFGGDHPQDLLLGPIKEYVNGLY